MARKEQPKVAFVLSGGASLGAIQVGMLRALYERDIRPALIVGTSAGALNGAYIASRPQASRTAENLALIWRELRRGQVFPVRPLTGLLGFLGARDHLVPESGLRRLIERHVEYEELEDLPIPLHVVAVDVVTGQELRLSSGPVLDAILASAAIPGVLQPVSWEDRTLMDGGVANNTPISHAVVLGAERIYVLPTGHACALANRPAERSRWRFTPSACSPTVASSTTSSDIATTSPDRHAAPMPAGHPAGRLRPRRRAHRRRLLDAREFLDSGGETRAPIRMRMHRHALTPQRAPRAQPATEANPPTIAP
jgi:predicted acylesterase/phospholipase RssA